MAIATEEAASPGSPQNGKASTRDEGVRESMKLSFVRLIAASVFVMGLAGCLTSPGTIMDVWRPIQERPSDPWRGSVSQLFTYVLVDDIGDGTADNASSTAKAGLTALLASVQVGLNLESAPAPLDKELLARANQYLIPGRGEAKERDKEQRVSWETYDRALAQQYLASFRLLVEGRPELKKALSGKGPFLVATREPLQTYRTNAATGQIGPVIVLNMSGVEKKAISEYVHAYQGAIRENVSNSREIKDLLPALANFLLKVDGAIPFIAEAYGNTVKMWNKTAVQK